MNMTLKVAAASAVLVLGSALPALAQMDNGIDFTTSVPFYAENVKLPAGSYRITQTDVNSADVLIRSTDGKYSAFLTVIPTLSEQPHQDSSVTFQKYGDTQYLDQIWVEGETYGVEVDRTKAEMKTASAATGAEQSSAGN
jgi:hypothetical protein